MTDDGSTEVSYYHMDSDTMSDTHKPDQETLTRLCYRDILQAAEDGRLELETPRGSVEQSDLSAPTIYTEKESEYKHGERFYGPTLIGIEFALSIDHEEVTRDLIHPQKSIVIYGNLHVWELSDPWHSKATMGGIAVGERVAYDHEHEWGTVKEIGWRD